MERVARFLKEVKLEFSKVTWPTREELIGSTKVVIVFSILLGISIFIIDRILTTVVGLILR